MIRTALSLILLTTAAPALAGGPTTNLPYTIQRRAAPMGGAREVTLPTNVVIDLTTWNTTRERSRLPVDRLTGYVDILVNPNGTAVLTTIYSSPAAVSLGGAFWHFWIAERSDIAAPIGTVAPTLPVGILARFPGVTPTAYTGPSLTGEYRLVTLLTRTGLVSTGSEPTFDDPAAPLGPTYSPGLPFTASQQGMNR